MNLARKKASIKKEISPEEKILRQVISYNFVRLMKKHGLKRKHLAEAYPCGASYVTQMIKGDTSIAFQALQRWGEVFGESMMEFLRPQYDLSLEPIVDKMIKHPETMPLAEAVIDAHIKNKSLIKG